jgi:hypothetical protein
VLSDGLSINSVFGSTFIKKSSVASSLPNVKPWLKRRRIKVKRNEIAALRILKIGWQLEDACCGRSQHCSMMQHKLRSKLQ